MTFYSPFAFMSAVGTGFLGCGCLCQNGNRLYQGKKEVTIHFKAKEIAEYKKEGRV
jgi:hypothetical protein